MTIVSSVLEPLDLAHAGTRQSAWRARRKPWTVSACPRRLRTISAPAFRRSKQRVIIARALTLRPKLIVCDEVVGGA